MEIELHIDALALQGFPAMDYERVGAALRTELTRLFVERGIPSALHQGWNAAAVQIGPLELSPGVASERVGMQVAQAIYERLCVKA